MGRVLLIDTQRQYVKLDFGFFFLYCSNANVAAKNIFAQCDNEGRMHTILKEITDHRKDSTAIEIANGFMHTKRGKRTPKTTTKGWLLLCLWKDGSSDWVDLKHLKDSNPIELAEYAVANRIQEELAFKWWVSDTLQARNRIIAKVKKQYWKTHRKYGVRLPHSRFKKHYKLTRKWGPISGGRQFKRK